MMLWRLAWRNLWRNPRRTGIVMVAVGVGLAGSLVAMGVNYGMIHQMVQTAIDTELGHVQVHALGWDDDPRLECRLEDGGAAAEAALVGSELRAVSRRVRGEGLISSPRASAGARLVGVEPDRELAVSNLRDSLIEGEWFGEKPRRVVIGRQLADQLKVGIGDKVALSVQDANGDLTGGGFRIAGIYSTSSSDFNRSVVLLRLGEAQDLLVLADGVTEVVAVARDADQIDALKSRASVALGGSAEVRSWGELQPLLVYMVQSFDAMAWYLYTAVFVAMAFGIANVLLMAVDERAREIGMLRAMGMRSRQVIALVVLESMLVVGVGMAIGIGIALGAGWALQDGIDLSSMTSGLSSLGVSPRIAPVIRIKDLVMPSMISLVVALLASLWPASRATAERPADALRRI